MPLCFVWSGNSHKCQALSALKAVIWELVLSSLKSWVSRCMVQTLSPQGEDGGWFPPNWYRHCARDMAGLWQEYVSAFLTHFDVDILPVTQGVGITQWVSELSHGEFSIYSCIFGAFMGERKFRSLLCHCFSGISPHFLVMNLHSLWYSFCSHDNFQKILMFVHLSKEV